jgi:hypothetical protein
MDGVDVVRGKVGEELEHVDSNVLFRRWRMHPGEGGESGRGAVEKVVHVP